jgi:hypothetical protein
MKEHELTALMDRASDGLAPDVEALVARGTARGRRTLRRRRVASCLGAAAAVGAIAVAATVLTDGGGTPAHVPGRDIAASPTTTAPDDGPRELADRPVIEERLLEALPEGEVTELSIKTHAGDDGALLGVEVRLLLDGAEVTMSIDDTSLDPVPDPGPRPAECDESGVGHGDGSITIDELQDSLDELAARWSRDDEALRACLDWVAKRQNFECAQDAACWKRRQAPPPCNDAACSHFPDGSWLRSGTEATYEDDPGRATEWPRAWATRATADHWWLSVDAGGPAKWAAPVLSQEQVAALAESDLWFE